MQEDTQSRLGGATPPSCRLSYKFQRLREQIRSAISRGEFHDQLPGERELGRRFNANAKTVNKALCDLSSEGLLVRQIGRGTFVASGNGNSGGAAKARTIVCLHPSTGERSSLVDSIMIAVSSKGHVCQMATGMEDEHGGLPMSAWPANMRKETDAILCFPREPLSGCSGRMGDEIVAEAWRRHVPCVVVGACSHSAKLHAVMPDYVDAGFRVTEHLHLAGCSFISILHCAGSGRETQLVLSGSQSAAARYGRPILPVAMESPASNLSAILLEGLQSVGKASRGAARSTMGLVCIGTAALRAALADPEISRARTSGRLGLACVMELGDSTARASDVTAYEVDPRIVTTWAARLLSEAKPGQRPTEVVIPGALRMRQTFLTGTEPEAMPQKNCAGASQSLAEALI